MLKQPTTKPLAIVGVNNNQQQRRVTQSNLPQRQAVSSSSRPSTSSRTPQPPTNSTRKTTSNNNHQTNNNRLRQQSAHNVHTTSKNSKIPDNRSSSNEPLIRYHNLDDEEPETLDEEEEDIQTVSVIPSFGRNIFHQQRVNINGDSVMKIRSPIIQTPVNIPSTEQKVVIKPPTKLTDSISALTKQYRKLGDFPFQPTIQPEKQESFSDEWSRKKQAALERRKNKSRNEYLARKVVDHWKWFARKGLDEIKAKNKRNIVLIFKTFQHWKRRKEERDNLWKKEFIVQTRQKFTLMQTYFNQWLTQLEISREREELYTDRAYSFLKRKLEHKVLKSLKLFVLQRKERREIIDIADTFANRRIIKGSLRKIKEG
ncbi:retrotransposon gag/pol polyprotein [Naegleria gruberi]|uniref:Retrotransposon gag/pol polyprotein n=1 Tax=Naegleria gruberi TaxID=5762 RepID=D2V0L6_NAEGR|nr:retrotransposon gag/pol polyprotein [Naegleria gruberi]EFC49543.1 retrotransposon gag/pol polyprotein [Naegleria gruberi]|eukprot:XP_002682287.1 retrotransposon gag/pol polyprotein [Naegleria gruberi strain NEG-M]